METLMREFADWQRRYSNAPPAERVKLAAAGEALARERRAALKALIQSDPQRALQLAVPPGTGRDWPPAVVQLLEQWVSGRGALGVIVADDFERKRSTTIRTVTLGGQSYRVFVYGRRLDQPSSRDEPLQGIVIDGLMAVAEEAPVLPENGGAIRK